MIHRYKEYEGDFGTVRVGDIVQHGNTRAKYLITNICMGSDMKVYWRGIDQFGNDQGGTVFGSTHFDLYVIGHSEFWQYVCSEIEAAETSFRPFSVPDYDWNRYETSGECKVLERNAKGKVTKWYCYNEGVVKKYDERAGRVVETDETYEV